MGLEDKMTHTPRAKYRHDGVNLFKGVTVPRQLGTLFLTMTIPKLYDFQQEIEVKTQTAMINKHRRILIQSPTGSGKTMMFAKNVYNADIKNKKTLIITDRIELLNGSDDTIKRFGIETKTILAGQKYPPVEYKHCIAMSQTLRLRIKENKWQDFFNSFDLVIIDEAHVQEFNVYFVEQAFKNNPFILAYTATPKRTGKQRQLSDDYSIMIPGPQIPELIARGFLVKDKYYAPRKFNINNIELNSFGDFKESQMFKRFEETISYTSIIENWQKICNDTISICFCVNIEHVLNTCKAFNDAGIKSKFIVSPISCPKFDPNMSDEQFVRYKEKKSLYDKYLLYMNQFSGSRDEIITEWKNGKFKVLINAGIYTKGFDYKQIETVIVLRSTLSEALWLQMIGRGSRIYPGKDFFNILDFGSNAERLGLYSQERVFSLSHNKSDGSGVAPVKECGYVAGKKKKDKYNKDGCGCLILTSKDICNYCGYVFEKEKIEIDINLIHIEYGDDNYSDNAEFSKFERIAESRGYKFGWVINQVIAKGGIDLLVKFAKYKDYKNSWIYSAEKRYEQAIKNYEEKMSKLSKDNKEK